MRAMLEMKKIDIVGLQKAYEGRPVQYPSVVWNQECCLARCRLRTMHFLNFWALFQFPVWPFFG